MFSSIKDGKATIHYTRIPDFEGLMKAEIKGDEKKENIIRESQSDYENCETFVAKYISDPVTTGSTMPINIFLDIDEMLTVGDTLDLPMILFASLVKNLEHDKTLDLMEYNLELLQKLKTEENPELIRKLQEIEPAANQKYENLLIDNLHSEKTAEREHAYKVLSVREQLNSFRVKMAFLYSLESDDPDIREEAIKYFIKHPGSFNVPQLIENALLKNLNVHGGFHYRAMRILKLHGKENIPQIAQIYRDTLKQIHQSHFHLCSVDMASEMIDYLLTRKEQNVETLDIIKVLLSKHLSCWSMSIRYKARFTLERMAAPELIVQTDTENISNSSHEVRYEAASELFKKRIRTEGVIDALKECACATYKSNDVWLALGAIELLYSHFVSCGSWYKTHAAVYFPLLEKIALDSNNQIDIRNQALNQMSWHSNINSNFQRDFKAVLIAAKDKGPEAVTNKANAFLIKIEEDEKRSKFQHKRSLDVNKTLFAFFPTDANWKCRDLITSYCEDSMDEEKDSARIVP